MQQKIRQQMRQNTKRNMKQRTIDSTMHATIEKVSPWVARFAGVIPTGGEVLDLACGSGRHARLLAAYGHPVLAVDHNAESLALAAGDGITTLQLDLEADEGSASQKQWPFETNRFAGIVVTNYLHRPLWAQMISSLAIGGMLIYETFAQGNEQFGKPSNPAFLLERAELLQVAQNSGLQILAFEDGCVNLPKPAMVQRICAYKADSSPRDSMLLLENMRLN